MKIFVPKEVAAYEARVSATPASVKKLIALGASVVVESGAGVLSSISDDDYIKSGATIGQKNEIPADADIKLAVNPAILEIAGKKFDLVKVPRITRAQSMDILSSQANLAGYRAVIDALNEFGKAAPMMMTAAGTITPAKVCVVGAGVAGLQAIATAKRMGAVVSAFDVRAVAKEQVQSLGAKFIEVEGSDGEGTGGYAKEVSEEYKARQAQALKDALAKSDIVITTAQIPGRAAPRIITADMVAGMQAGSIIVDIAVGSGGNCELSKVGETVVTSNGVKILGHPNLPSKLAQDASKLFAQNVVNFLGLVIKDGKINIDDNDEIIKATKI
jgi:NAD(P) transhydrogenase subunit alpha